MAECLQYDGVDQKRPDVVFVRPQQASLLPSGASKIVIIVLREMDKICARLVATKSRAEFETARRTVFPDYANLCSILSNSFSTFADKTVREQANTQGFQHVINQFKTHGREALSAAVIGEVIFCVTTLKRAYKLVSRIDEINVPLELKEKDNKLASEFNIYTVCAQLHTDCLRFALGRRIGLNEEVLEELLEGMRASVMAYSYVRQGLELRTTREPFLSSFEQDDEDRELLEESYLDSETGIDADPEC
jgi:hypothetical protein